MRFFFIIAWFIFGSVIGSPTGKGVFGVCVSYQATGNYTTYIAYIQTASGMSHRRTLTEAELIKFAAGYWPNAYNSTKENLFALNHLDCNAEKDYKTQVVYTYCSPLDSLWKLRFQLAPMKGIQAEGWSGKEFRPSTGQEQYLYKEFGIYNIDRDFFVDTNFWKLLRSVKDPEWINHYKNLP